MNSEIYNALKDDKELIELLYNWYRFPDVSLRNDLRAAIPKINQYYPHSEMVTLYRGFRRQKENKKGHLVKRNSNWKGINLFNLREGKRFNLKIDQSMSFSKNEFTAQAFTINGRDRLLIESQVEIPSSDYLVYTDEIYRAILMRYHVTALSAPGMEEVVAVPERGQKIILPCKVNGIKVDTVRNW